MKSQELSFKRILFIILALLLVSCDDFTGDSKGPIGDKRATAEFLLKVPRLERKVFVVNTNGYGTSMGYDSGSLQVYSATEQGLNNPEQSLEIPSLASTVAANDNFVFITYDTYGDEKASVLVIPYSISASQELTFAEPTSFLLERDGEGDDDVKDPKSSDSKKSAKKKLRPRYSYVNENFFVSSCQGGELFVMDLRESELQAPVHVRSYGDKVQRSALSITSNNYLLMFPGKSSGSETHYDKEDTYTEADGPKTINKGWDLAKMGISPYKLIVFDLNKDLSFEELNAAVEERESFWLSFDLKGTKSEGEKKYYRTHFDKVEKSEGKDTFYLMQKSSEEKKKLNRLLKLKVDIKSLRGESKDLAKALKFSEDPVFSLKEGENKFKSVSDSGEKEEKVDIKFALDSFHILDEANNEVVFVSYNFKANNFALVKTGAELPVLLHHTESNKKAYKGLVVFGDGEQREYLTIKDYYRFGAKLVLNQL